MRTSEVYLMSYADLKKRLESEMTETVQITLDYHGGLRATTKEKLGKTEETDAILARSFGVRKGMLVESRYQDEHTFAVFIVLEK